MGNLYQLHSHTNLNVGDCIFVNGPYDEFGYIVKMEKYLRDGFQLYLIRGTGRIPADWPIHDSVTFSEPSKGGAYVRETSSYGQKYCDKCKRKLD